LYPLSLVPESIRGLMAFNPLVYLIEPLRGALILDQGDGLAGLMIATAAMIVLVGFGLSFFGRLAGRFEDFF